MTNPIVLGLLFGTGLVLVGFSFLRPAVTPAADGVASGAGPRQPVLHRPAGVLSMVVVAVGAIAVTVVFWMVFKIAVLAVAAGAAVAVPPLVRRRGANRPGVELTAKDLGETAATVARWIEGVRDYLTTAATLQDALVQASLDVRGPFARDFERFASTLSGAGGFPAAAQELADELRSALADKALTALWIGGREGGDVQTALTLLADSAQVEADNARRIEAGLAGTRRLVQLVSVLCGIIFVLALFAFRDNFGIYRSVGGQFILAVGLAVITVSWWAIWRMSKIEAPERLVSVRPVGGGRVRSW
ncbi:MAG: type II secretion system F family protein [Acidimicrobiales bacterium]